MRLLKSFAVAAAIALLAVMTPTPVSAAETMNQPGAVLHLSWSAPDNGHQVYSTTLTCDPINWDQTEVILAAQACAEIATANGDFANLPGWWYMNCDTYQGWRIRTMATGHWYGQPVSHDVIHDNLCEARKATGSVFLF